STQAPPPIPTAVPPAAVPATPTSPATVAAPAASPVPASPAAATPGHRADIDVTLEVQRLDIGLGLIGEIEPINIARPSNAGQKSESCDRRQPLSRGHD